MICNITALHKMLFDIVYSSLLVGERSFAKAIFANPDNPVVCPILALALHLVSYCVIDVCVCAIDMLICVLYI